MFSKPKDIQRHHTLMTVSHDLISSPRFLIRWLCPLMLGNIVDQEPWLKKPACSYEIIPTGYSNYNQCHVLNKWVSYTIWFALKITLDRTWWYKRYIITYLYSGATFSGMRNCMNVSIKYEHKVKENQMGPSVTLTSFTCISCLKITL